MQVKPASFLARASRRYMQKLQNFNIPISDGVYYSNILRKYAEAYSKSYWTSKMDCFVKIVDGFMPGFFQKSLKNVSFFIFHNAWNTPMGCHKWRKCILSRVNYFESSTTFKQQYENFQKRHMLSLFVHVIHTHTISNMLNRSV